MIDLERFADRLVQHLGALQEGRHTLASAIDGNRFFIHAELPHADLFPLPANYIDGLRARQELLIDIDAVLRQYRRLGVKDEARLQNLPFFCEAVSRCVWLIEEGQPANFRLAFK